MRTGAPPSIESSFRSSPAGWRRRAAAGRRRRDTGVPPGCRTAATCRRRCPSRRSRVPRRGRGRAAGLRAGDPPRAAGGGAREEHGDDRERKGRRREPGAPAQHGPERMEHVRRALGAGDAEVADRHVGQRERVAREPRDGSRGEHPHRGVERAAPRLRHDLHRERQQREQADGREQRPGAEREARPRLPPADREPGEREDAVDERGGLRDVREREDGRGEGDRETQPRGAERGGPGGERDEREQRGRPEREERAADERRDRGEPGGREAARERDGGRGPADARRGPGAAGRRAAGRRAAGLAALRGPGDVRLAQLGREPRGGRALRGVHGERGVDGGEEPAGQVGAARGERRRARGDRGRDLRERDAPEGVAPGERLPEDHADGPDVAPLGGLLAREPLGRDVRERPGHVADGGQRVGLVELGEPEVEDADRQLLALLDEHVRGLHVPVHDPAPVGVGEAVEHLGGDLDRLGVREAVGAEGLAERAPPHVLVRDVDVARVSAEVVGAHAALVTQPRGGLHLPARARGALALARDDLERHLEARPLVVGQPDRAGAAPAERLQGPVAVEDEGAIGEGEGGVRHEPGPLRRGRRTSSAAGSPVTLGRVRVVRRELPAGRRRPRRDDS